MRITDLLSPADRPPEGTAMTDHTTTTDTRDAHGRRRHAGKNTDKAGLSRNRRRDVVENDEYAKFVRRVVRAYTRRVASGDVETWPTWPGSPGTWTTQSARPRSGCTASDTRGPRSETAWASPARPPVSGGNGCDTDP